MHVVWKRPDGHLDSSPSDYRVVSVGSNCKIWLHLTEQKWFPFRISGGWQDEDASQKLNGFINLLDASDEDFNKHSVNVFNYSESDDGSKFFDETKEWLADLKNNLKGDTWEMEIMGFVISEVEDRFNKNKDQLLKDTAN